MPPFGGTENGRRLMPPPVGVLYQEWYSLQVHFFHFNPLPQAL